MMPPLEKLQAHYDGLCERLERLSTAIETRMPVSDQLPSPQYGEWENFFLFGQTVLAGGATSGDVTVQPCQIGWEGGVRHISVAVSGASSGATGAVFAGDTEDPTCLVDVIPQLISLGTIQGAALYGASADYDSPVDVRRSRPILVWITGAAANATITITVEGRRRQVQAGFAQE